MAFFETSKGRPGEHANAESLRRFMQAKYIRIRMQKLLAPIASGDRKRLTHPIKLGRDGKEVL